MLNEKDLAPDFSLPDQDGKVLHLKDFRGQKVVLFFYPADDTPACTKEACSLGLAWPDLRRQKVVVLGVSPDGAVSHQRFRSKFDLPYPLLTDAELKVLTAYDAWGEKNLYGKIVIGVKRSTFVIGEDGRILKIYRRVRTATHGQDVLAYLEAEAATNA